MNNLIRFSLIAFLIWHSNIIIADEDKHRFDESLIAPELLKDANAVVRNHVAILEIDSPESYTYHVNSSITILNKHGRDFGKKIVYYDAFRKITNLEGKLYDKHGNFIRKSRPKEINDFALEAFGPAYSNNRAKHIELSYGEFPYTIEYGFTIKVKGVVINYPPWVFRDEERLSVEKSILRINAPEGLKVFYHLENMDIAPKITVSNSMMNYEWTVENLPAIKWEYNSPPLAEICPVLYTKPLVYQIEKYQGLSDSWENIGHFFHELNEGRDALPEGVKAEVKRLVSNHETIYSKAKILYKYLQNNTRYVSIQLGIGGWQSFDAEFVHRNKYGDCKALTNYMQSLLKAAGVESFPVLIRAGYEVPELIDGFPSNQFNHVILCVPDGNDSIWLECTSQTSPFGYLGRFTAGRKALLVSEEGGKLIHTPGMKPEDNIQIIEATVQLQEDGNASCEGVFRFTGYQYEKPFHIHRNSDEQETRDWFKNYVDISSVNLNMLQFELPPQETPEIDLNFDMDVHRIAAKTSTRLFLCLNFIDKLGKLTEYPERRFPVYNNYPYLDECLFSFVIPEGYTIESKPDFPVLIQSEFGNYYANISLSQNADTLYYERRLTKYEYNLPQETYAKLAAFNQSAAKADHEQVVLRKE